MVYRISELPAGTPPYNGTALLELSVPNPGAPTGYDSRKALVADVFGAAAAGNVCYPANHGIRNDGVDNAVDDFAAMLAHMQSLWAGGGGNYPPVTAQPLIFPGGAYKMAAFTSLPLWGHGATVSGYGYVTVLDNIGIEIHNYRHQLVERMMIGKRDNTIVPGSYGLWIHHQPRMSIVDKIDILHKDIAVLGGATLYQTTQFPANVQLSNVRALFSRIGFYAAGNFACEMSNCIFGGSVAEYAAILYGTQGLKSFGGFWNAGSENALKIVGNRRHQAVENYFVGTTFTGASGFITHPVLAVANDGGFARLTLGTKIGATLQPHAPVLMWDPFFKEMRSATGPLVEGVAHNLCRAAGTTGRVDQINIGGTNLLSAPIPCASTTAGTVDLIVAAVNAGTATHGYSALDRGLFFYLDALGNRDAVGRVITITTSGGDFTISPDLCAALVYDTPHGRALRDDVRFEVTQVVANATIAGTTMTVHSVVSGGDNIFVGQLVYGAGISAGVGLIILSQDSGTAGGAGVYTLSTTATATGDVTIGTRDYDGQMTVDALIDDHTIITRLPGARSAVGQAWKQLFLGPGILLVTILGAPQHINVQLTAVDDISVLTAIPFASIGVPTTLQQYKFEVDIESMDVNVANVNDQFFNWGNVNFIRIRSAYNCFFVGPRPAKNFFWIDKRSDERMRSNRIFIIRSGRGREYDTDTDNIYDNTIEIHGTNEGFGVIEMTSGEGTATGTEGIQITVGQAGAPLVNNVAPLVAHRLTGQGITDTLGEKAVMFLDGTGMTTPWLRAWTNSGDATINRIVMQAGGPAGSPRIDVESYGDTPDDNVSLTLDTKGTGFLRVFNDNVEKVRVTAANLQTMPGVATTFPPTRAGRVTLPGGSPNSISVPAIVTSATEAMLSRRTLGGTAGTLSYSVNTTTQMLTITSSSATDTSTISFALIGSV